MPLCYANVADIKKCFLRGSLLGLQGHSSRLACKATQLNVQRRAHGTQAGRCPRQPDYDRGR